MTEYMKNREERIREGLEIIKQFETVLEYAAYEVGRNYLPEKVACKKKLTLEEIERLDPREVEVVMVTPPKHEHLRLEGIEGNSIYRVMMEEARGGIKLREFSPTLAKIRFNHFMNDSQVRGVFPEMEWTVRGFHDFVRINLNNYPSSVMALRKLDPEKITGFEIEEIPPRYGGNHRMKVDVFTKEEV